MLKKENLSIFVGTKIQEKLTLKILPTLLENLTIKNITIISLEKLYRLGIRTNYSQSVIHINDLPSLQPWYDRSLILKLITLIPFIIQIFKLSLKSKNNLFFVDTGILERSAIFILNLMKRQTIVLQDAMKRNPKQGERGMLNSFGNGKAHNYLLMGSRYFNMVQNRPAYIVGSPIFKNKIYFSSSKGEKILFINQCFSRYSEISEEQEIDFVKDIITAIEPFGPIEIRLHPHNNYPTYKSLSGKNVEITWQKPLKDSLKEAGIVLAINSTTILEALSFGLPVLTLDWHPTKFELPIQESVIHCDTIETMTGMLSKWKKMGPDFYIPQKRSLQRELQNHIAFSGQEAIDRIGAAFVEIVTKKVKQ